MRAVAAPLLLAVAACATTGDAEVARAAGPRDYWLYVSAESADEVYKVRFDGERAEVARVIDVGALPTEIEGPHGMTVAPDGRHWFLTMAHGKPFGALYKFSTETDELVGQVELGLFPATMQVSAETGLLYCVNFDLHGDMSPSSVSVVDPDAMVEVARTTTGPMPHGSRVSPDGLRHYSCSMMKGRLYEIDATTFEVVRVLDFEAAGDAAGAHAGHRGHGASKPTWVHPHPREPRAYVCLSGVDEVVEVDLEAWAVARRFATGAGPYNVEVTPDGRRMVVSYKAAGAVGVWDLASGRELARIPSSRRVTHGVVIADDGRYAFVSCEGVGGEAGTLDVIDLGTSSRACTLELGLQAGGITFWKSEPRARRAPETAR